MPTFETLPLPEARLKTADGRTARHAQEYMDYIQQLGDGQAGKLQLTEGEKILTIRRRLTTTATLLGKELTIKRLGDELYFWVALPEEEKPRRRSRRSIFPRRAIIFSTV